MARRLILDTGVLIASERGRAKLADLIAEDDDAAIAAITAAELRTGVELASDRYHVARAALVHGELLAYVQRTGGTRGAHELIVAATALATGRAVVTTDRSARFRDLPGVSCLQY